MKAFKAVLSIEGVRNLQWFWVLDFFASTEIEILENSKFFSKLLNLKAVVLLEEVGVLGVFQVFDFGSYTGNENSRNFKIFWRLKVSK